MTLQHVRYVFVALSTVVIQTPAYAVSSADLGEFFLNVGAGDGQLDITTTATGESQSAIFDPIGDIFSADTFFDSYIAFGQEGVGFSRLEEIATSVSVDEISDFSVVSQFSIGNLAVQMTQTVVQNSEEGVITGATFNQVMNITNTSAEIAEAFSLRRYLDGDLSFDGSISDGGGVMELGGNRVLFEVDAVAGGDEPDVASTFVGINAVGGSVPETGSFEVSSYSGLNSIVLNGDPLGDFVEGDFDPADGFADFPYDITMALQNDFLIAPEESATYVTQSIFGNSTPPAPGSSEDFPILPGDSNGGETGDSFVFELPADAIVEGEILFFDPIIAVGYTYEVTGAEFASVQAPSLGAVNDADGYMLLVHGQSFALAAGQLINFADVLGLGAIVTSFEIIGINPDLELDPNDATAFLTGIAFQNVTGPITLLQTPQVVDTDAAVVPLPAAGWLLAGGLLAVSGTRRLRHRA